MSTIDSFSLSSHNGSTSASSHSGIEDFGQYSVNDIIKVGYMKKLKTNKRKYFVLRLNNYPGDDSASIGGFASGGIGCGGVDHATLSYYDNEKKFRANLSSSGQTPRRTILVRECFAFDRKIDAKHRFVLAIYTKEDCLCTIVDDQQQLTEWLEALRNILHHSIDYLQRKRLDFEHIWQVNISRTVGLTRSLTGLHRICLSGNVLHVIRVDPSTYNSEVNEFPLNSIRRCGHSQSTFFLELGRSSSIGPGEVWMQTDDQSLAQNMHEVILSAMTAGSTTGADEESGISSSHRTSSLSYRPRSSSASVNESKSSLNSSSFQQSGRNSANIRHNSFKHSTHSNGLVQYEGATGTGTGHTAGFVHYGGPGQCYHHHHGHHPCVGRNSSAATIASNGSSQPSPSNSREHLHHSGSWSRTASECSNEDLMGSQGAFSSVSGNAGVPASGGPTINYFDCVANIPSGHLWSSPNLNCCCYSSSTFANSNCSVDFSNGNSTSSLSADCDSDLAQMNSLEYHSMHDRTATGCLLTTGHEPPISEEADGAGSDDYFPMNPTSIAAAAAASVKHHSQQSTASGQLHCGGGGQHSMMSHHRHYHRSVSTTSPITSPKYNGQCCCNCQLHFNGNKPGMMITDDYLPMSPVGNSALLTNGASSGAILCSPNSHENGNTSKHSVATTNDDDEDSGYLVMAPLSPASSSTSKNLSESINRSGNLVLCTSPSDGGSVLHNEPQVAVNPVLVPTSSVPDDSIFSGLTRAYSTGSKPQPLAPSLGAQCIISVPSVANQLPTPTTVISSMMTTNDTGTNSSMSGGSNLRIRAFSTGSHGMLNPNVIRMNSRRLKKHLLQQQQQQQQQIQHNHNNTLATSFDGGDTILSSNSSLTEESAAEMLKSTCLLSAKNSKAFSAPILSPLVQQRARSATIGARPSMAGNTGGTVAGLTQTAPLVTTATAATSGLGIGHWQPQFYHQGGSTANKQQQQQHSHLIYSNSAGSKPPPLNENDDDDEGDLMEIDYSDKAKHRSKSNILNDEDDDDNCDVILSNFEEQLLREAKKLNQTQRRRSRQNHAGGASSSDSVIAALQAAAAAANASNQPLMSGPAIPNYYSDSPTGRKRSDSTSAVGTFFGPSRPTHHHHHHYHPNMHAHQPHHQLLSQSQSQQHSINSHLVNQHQHHHQPRHNTLDSFVASFKNTLSLNQNLDTTSTTTATPTTNVTSTTATPTTQDEDQSQQQQPANVNTPNKDSKSCTALAGTANRPIHPRKSANLKQQHLTNAKPDPVDCEPADADEYTMMAPLSVTLASNSKNLNSKSPDSVSSSATTSDLQVKMALAMKKVDLKSNVDDDDASPYVVMCPVDSGGGSTSRKSHSNNTSSTSSKKSMKSVRSLLFGPSSASQSQSSTTAAAVPNNNLSNQNSATRKKSSTFSGKLRIGSRNGGNSEKRKTTKSESSSTDQQTPVAPVGSNISPTPTTTSGHSAIGTVSTTTTTTTITSPSLA